MTRWLYFTFPALSVADLLTPSAFPFFLRGLQFVQQCIEAHEIFFPQLAISIEPDFQLLERSGPQRVDPTLRVHAYVDQSGFTEHPQMLRDLRLPKTQLIDQITDRARPVQQHLDDLETVRFGEGSECLDHHGVNMPQ
jgi:hypothetical protein